MKTKRMAVLLATAGTVAAGLLTACGNSEGGGNVFHWK